MPFCTPALRHARSLAAAFAALACVAAAPSASAQDYPTRPIKLVLPFGPGGIADISSRLVADALGKRLGQTVIIDNQPGAGGVVAARAALNGRPDGYTTALLSNGTAISVPLFAKLPFDPLTDFAPVSSFATFAFIMVVKADSPLRSVADLIASAKAKPGKLNFGTINVGSSQNLAAALFKSTAAIDAVTVPYRATPDAVAALLAGDVDVVIDSYASLKATLTNGKARVIASTGAVRSKALPDVPTVAESGLAGYDVSSWNGMFVPAGTSPEIIARLNREIGASLAEPELQKRFLDLGMEAHASTPAELEARLKADIAKWTPVIEKAGIPKQ
jgi:tripartite-type tricarboxylate transporter receptor subunit TctC